MRLISFAWTTAAVVARKKTCTRREWRDEFALKHKKGQMLEGTDKVLFAGGRKIPDCVIRLTEDVYYEHIKDMPDSDYVAEGFEYLDSIGARTVEHWREAGCMTWKEAFDYWRGLDRWYWVVRFEYPILEAPQPDLFNQNPERPKTFKDRLQAIRDTIK